MINLVAQYDNDGTYFRYPMVKSSINKDDEKYSMKDVVNDLATMDSDNKAPFIYIIQDADDNIVDAYGFDELTLHEVEEALYKIVEYLDGFHSMTRHTFFNGY